jgi:hypothetical protein
MLQTREAHRRDGGYNVVVFEVKKEIPAQSRSDRTAVRAEQCSREQDPVQPLTTTYRKSALRLPCAKAEDRCPDHRELQPDSVYRDSTLESKIRSLKSRFVQCVPQNGGASCRDGLGRKGFSPLPKLPGCHSVLSWFSPSPLGPRTRVVCMALLRTQQVRQYLLHRLP